MKRIKNRPSPPRPPRTDASARALFRSLLLPGLLLLPARLLAQSPSSAQAGSTGVVDPQSSQTAPAAAVVPVYDTGESQKPWKAFGPFEFHPHASYQGTYNDNIYLSSKGKTNDFIHVFSPGLLLGGWDYLQKERAWLTFDYTLGGVVFTKESVNDTIDHYAFFDVGSRFGDLKVDLAQSFVSTTDPLTEAGGRLARKTYNTVLTANYSISDRTSFEALLRQEIIDHERLISSKEWSDANWLNYQIFPRLSLAVGATFGYLMVENGFNATYEQGRVRATYNVSQKISASVNGGYEFRQFQASKASGDLLSPVFGVQVSYRPVDPTFIALDATQEVVPSRVFASKVATSTGFSLRLEQRFFHRFFFEIAGGYVDNEYTDIGGATGPAGSYSYYFWRPQVTWQFRQKLKFNVFYQHHTTTSKVVASYDDNQTGIGVSYLF